MREKEKKQERLYMQSTADQTQFQGNDDSDTQIYHMDQLTRQPDESLQLNSIERDETGVVLHGLNQFNGPLSSYKTSNKIGETLTDRRYLQINGGSINVTETAMESKFPGTAINFLTTIVFLGVFMTLIYLIKRHLTKFISFYIVKQDYQRLRCMQNDDDPFVDLDAEVGLQDENLNNAVDIPFQTDPPRYSTPDKFHSVDPPVNSRFPTPLAISRSMTNHEIFNEYKTSMVKDMKIYHPLISTLAIKCTTQALNNHVNLPKTVSITLTLSWLLLTLTMTFTFQDLGKQFLGSSICKDSRSAIILYLCKTQENLDYESNSGVAFLVASVTALVTILLAKFMTTNYYKFLEMNKKPLTEVEILQDEYSSKKDWNSRQKVTQMIGNSSNKQDTTNMFLRHQRGSSEEMQVYNSVQYKRGAKKQSVLSNSQDTDNGWEGQSADKLYATSIKTQQQPQTDIRGLYPIQEDDEEQPFSPSIHQNNDEEEEINLEDDLGDDEIGPGKPQNARGGVMTTGAGSSIRKINPMRNSKAKLKNSPSQKSSVGLNKNSSSASFLKEDRGETCERCHMKNGKMRCTHLQKGSFIQSSSAGLQNMPSKIELAESSNQRIINLFPTQQQRNSQANLTERYGSSTNDAITPTSNQNGDNGPQGGETEMDLIKYLGGHQQTNRDDGNGNTPEKTGFAGQQSIDIHGSQSIRETVVWTPELRKKKLIHLCKLIFLAVYYLCLMMCPLYILNQLSVLSQPALSACLLTFLYSLLFDTFIVRPVTIFVWSIVQTKLKLKAQYYLTEANDQDMGVVVLAIEELNQLGMIYESYQQTIITPLESKIEDGERPALPLKSEEDHMLASERPLITESQKQEMLQDNRIVNKLVRRKLPTGCDKYILHETVHIQTIYIAHQEFQDGIFNRDVGAVPTDGGIFTSTSRLITNQVQVTAVEGDLEAGRFSPDKKIISKPFIHTESDDTSPLRMIQVNPSQLAAKSQEKSGDLSVIQADHALSSRNQKPLINQENQGSGQNFETPHLNSPLANDRQPQQQSSKQSISRNLAASNYNNSCNSPKEENLKKGSTIGSKKVIAKLLKENNVNKTKGKSPNKKGIKSRNQGDIIHGDSMLEVQSQQYVTDQKERHLLTGSIHEEQQNDQEQFKSPSKQKNKKGGASQQFSPKYSSFGKTSPRGLEEETKVAPGYMHGIIDQRSIIPAPMILRDDQGEVASKIQTFINIRNSVKNSLLNEHGTEIRGSFMGSKGSLLKSVLNQNREKESIDNNCDFSEIIKPSPRLNQENNTADFIEEQATKQFLSPKASLFQASSQSKKKKFASFIVQPDPTSPLRESKILKDTDLQAFKDIKLNTEEDDLVIKHVEDIKQNMSNFKHSQVEQHAISIINDQTIRNNSPSFLEVNHTQPQNIARLNSDSSSEESPREVTTQIMKEEIQTIQKKQNQQKQDRPESNRSNKRNLSTPGNSGKKSSKNEIPKSLLRRQKEKLIPKLEKAGTMSSILEPISEDKDEALKSYSKLNFKDYSKERGFLPVNNQIGREKLTSQTQQRSSSQVASNLNKIDRLKPEFRAKQKDLFDKLGQRIARKNKNRIQTEIVEEEIPGRTMENWTKDLHTDTYSPSPDRKFHQQMRDDDEDYPKIQLQGIEEDEIVLNKLSQNHRGTGSVGSKPSFATVQQLQSLQYGASNDSKTNEDNHGQVLKNRTLKNNSSSGASSNQLLGSGRNKRIYSSHSSKRPSNRNPQTMNMIHNPHPIDEEEILVMSRPGDKDAFSLTAKKPQKTNNILPNRASSSNANFIGVRTSYNNGVIILDNQQDQQQDQKRFSETLQQKIRQNQLIRQQQELEAKKKKEAVHAKFAVDEQTRQLKKVLELAKSLNKKKDASKISDMLQQMRDSQKPLPLATVNELRKLELMESPYSQPLIGMIKEIEAQIQTRFGTGDGTKINKKSKKSRRDVSENASSNGGDLQSAMGSRKKLKKFIGLQSSNSRVQSQGSLGSSSNSSYHIVSQQPSLSQIQHLRQASVEETPLKDDNGYGKSQFNLTNVRASHQNSGSDPQLPQLAQQKSHIEKLEHSRPDTGQMSQSSKNTNNVSMRRNIISPPYMNIEEDPFSDPMSRRITMDPEQKKNITAARQQKLSNLRDSGKSSIKFRLGHHGNALQGTITSETENSNPYQTIDMLPQKEKSVSLQPAARNQKSSSKKKKRTKGNNLPQTSQSYYSTINQILVEHEMEESVLEVNQVSSKKQSLNQNFHEDSAADYEVR